MGKKNRHGCIDDKCSYINIIVNIIEEKINSISKKELTLNINPNLSRLSKTLLSAI
jgi:hypothetical protein